jgi:hypothetical protein
VDVDALAPDVRRVVVVEGTSDRLALEALARRRSFDAAAAGVAVVEMHGITNVSRDMTALVARGIDVAGLCDAGEVRYVRQALERCGVVVDDRSVGALERHGFFVCDVDLEDELIRALGESAAERFVESQGELETFRRFQRQPAQRERSLAAQLHRFVGTRSGRKHRYAPAMVDALDLARVPAPLDRLLDHLRRLDHLAS